MTITGECFCGEVAYEVNGKLHDARSCHCSRCRKAFSSAASAYALVNSDEFSWIKGEGQLTSYVNEYGFGLQFCSKCGSTLCGVFQEKIHGVTLGCTNDSPDVVIEKHIFVGSKSSWDILPEGAVKFEKGAPEAG